jgi:hypothetical protein
VVTPGVTEEREDGIVAFTLEDVHRLGVEDEIIRWSYTGKRNSLVLSDVEVVI